MSAAQRFATLGPTEYQAAVLKLAAQRREGLITADDQRARVKMLRRRLAGCAR